MIKGAAVAGAAAWTAPVIIDSLTSPAAADSACNIYWVKVTGPATNDPQSYYACPGDSSLFYVCDAYWGGGSGTPGNTHGSGTLNAPTNGNACSGTSGHCGKPGHLRVPDMVEADGYDGSRSYYRKVTLPSGCTFAASTGWQIGGRYSNSYLVGSGTCTSSPAYNSGSNGCYTSGGRTAWISRYLTPGDRRTTEIDYIYLKFCCTTA